MIATGILMLLISWVSVIRLMRKKDLSPFLARGLFFMTFSGWVATVAGWYVTEVGRQPWLVMGVLKTNDAISAVPAPIIGISLFMYLTVYVALMLAFIGTLFYMARKAADITGKKPAPTAGKAIVKTLTP
jgi:cytochrome d ubiquinol oxidase subunit I